MPSVRQNVHVFYAGRVQGVGFRMLAEETAHRFDIAGWVKNLRDGRVELVAEGDKKSLAKFLDEIRNGPMCNFITNVHVTWGPATDLFNHFDIRYF